MVKKFIRDHDQEEQYSGDDGPWRLIDDAFAEFEVGTVGGLLAEAHFNMYKSNHEYYLRRLA